jgi:hypothetical protein
MVVMKVRAKYGLRTLLVVMTLFAILMTIGLRLRNLELERQKLVSSEYEHSDVAIARFDYYARHGETYKLPFSRWIGNKLAASQSETQSILVDFHKPTDAEKIDHIISLFPEIQLVHFHCDVPNPIIIERLSRLSFLKSIQINDGRVDLATMKAIGKLPQRPQVTFQNTHLDDELLDDAVHSEIELYYIYSPTSSVSDVGLRSVAKLRSLISLCINDCQVSKEGIRVLERHPSLRYVYFENCPVDDSCVATLAALPGLYQLSLKGTKVTDVGARLLLTISPSLGELDIRSTAVSQDGIDSLAATCQAGVLKSN